MEHHPTLPLEEPIGNANLGQQVLSEEALPDRPALGQEAFLLEVGVYPVDGDSGIFDAMAGLGVVLDDLAGADTALQVNLVEDGCVVLGDSQAVPVHEHLDGVCVEDAVEEREEVAYRIQTNGLGDEVLREEPVGGGTVFRFSLSQAGACPQPSS